MGTFSQLLSGSSQLGVLVHSGLSGRPMTVWRVENKKGFGPHRVSPSKSNWLTANLDKFDATSRDLYRFVMSGDMVSGEGGIEERFELEELVQDIYQPTPDTDFPYYEWKALPAKTQSQYLFGFPTQKAAVDWFGAAKLRQLAKLGFTLRERKARRVVLSKTGRQVIFVPWETTYRRPPSNYMWRFESERAKAKKNRDRRMAKWRSR